MMESLHFEKTELLDILENLIKCKSDFPYHTEEEAAIYIHELFLRHRVESRLDWVAEGRPNVLAELKGQGDGKSILYNGHLDTVPPNGTWGSDPYEPVVINGKMYGRGTSDMKAGLASMIYAAIVLKRMGCPFQGKLLMVFNVDEERENLGIKHFIKGDFHADYAIIGEPTNLHICLAHKGVARYRLRTFASAKHAGHVNEKDENAVIHMAELIMLLHDENKRLVAQSDPILGNPSLSVTQIEGGTAINVIPESCQIELDRRLMVGEREREVTARLHELLDGEASYELENYLFIPASSIPADHLLVETLESVITKVIKRKPDIGAFNATCEAPFLSVDKGIPTVIFGPGSLEQAHRVNEQVEIEEVVDAAKIYMELVVDLLA